MVEGAEELTPSPGGAMTDARKFLGMEPVGDDLHWQLTVVPELTTPGNFLFGGCGLGAALVALEAACGPPDGLVDGPVPLLRPDRTRSSSSPSPWPPRVAGSPRAGWSGTWATPRSSPSTPRRARPRTSMSGGVWVAMPEVPPPEECPPRRLPTSARPRSSTASTCGWPGAAPFEEIAAGDGSAGRPRQRAVGPGARAPRAVGGHPGHHRRLRLGRRVPAARPPGHVPQPRQHPPDGAASSRPSGSSATSTCRRWWAATGRGPPTCGRRRGRCWPRPASR